VATCLYALGDDGIDANVGSLHGLLGRGSLHPDFCATGLQAVHPDRWWYVKMEDHKRHRFGKADVNMRLRDGWPEGRGIVEEIDAKEMRGQAFDQLDELLQTRWRFEGCSQDANTTRLGDRRNEGWHGHKAHTSPNKGVLDTVCLSKPGIKGVPPRTPGSVILGVWRGLVWSGFRPVPEWHREYRTAEAGQLEQVATPELFLCV
jgi:hypothetical protein